MQTNRRRFLKQAAISSVICASLPQRSLSAQSPSVQLGALETFVPCRAITRGPLHHWFGYYDKHEFDPSGRFVLANQVDFEGRSPTPNDKIKVGYVDLEQNDLWTEVGSSSAWGWQQGCMLQWVGQTGRQIMWNDRMEGRFVCHLLDLDSGSRRTINRPIYTLSADGRIGLSLNFSRLDNLRPGYGYEGVEDPNVAKHAPDDDGIWSVDLATGDSQLIFSYAQAAAITWPDGDRRESAWHYFNHLLLNPSGTRFICLHRYRPQFDPKTKSFEGNFVTRMFTVNIDGSDPFVLDPSGQTSHFIWKNDAVVTMWTQPLGLPNGFYEMTDRGGQPPIRRVGEQKMPVNGHNTYLPPPYDQWILNDCYPDGKTLRQTVYLYHPQTDRRIDLGHFPSPKAYRNEWRCDTHPRASRDGRWVAIDSPHDGGRQVYLLDLRETLARIA